MYNKGRLAVVAVAPLLFVIRFFRNRKQVPERGRGSELRPRDSPIASSRYRAATWQQPAIFVYRQSDGGDVPTPHPLGLEQRL